jgi:bifunctional non-homologous end joining protein LigD
MKYDGYRLEVAVGRGNARAYTRSGLDWSDKFAGIVTDAAALDVRSALIDREAVVMDANGRSSFQALQGALKGAPATIDYYAFDLLELDGEDLTGLPLAERKAKLRAILPEGNPRIRYSEHIQGNGEKLLHNFCEADLEGVISKCADARYIGSRSGGWLKTKCIKRQEFIVVGWTPSDKSRAFRSLILCPRRSARAASSSTIYATSAALRRSCPMPSVRVRTRQLRRRSPGRKWRRSTSRRTTISVTPPSW